jgi:diguanylate cyclase (GGDEF)-like protein
MPRTQLNLKEFPDSAYAHELQRSAPDLRFVPPLEAEYAAWHVQRVHLRVKVYFTINVVLALLFSAEQMYRTGIGDAATLVHLTALVPCTIAMAWLAWSRNYERFYLPVASVLAPIFSALIAVLATRGISQGRDEQLAALTVSLIGIFFFTGLRFRESLLTVAVMLPVFLAAAVGFGLTRAATLKSMVILVLTSIISTIVYRDVEKSHRTSFLESALIMDLVARDGLSGLMNRRTFDEHLLRVWQQALRDRRSIAVLMIDIDHFKRYNDAFGHQGGDMALRGVAQAIQEFARRPWDLAARFGGEEFAVVLYDLPLIQVQDVAERIRLRVQDLRINWRDAGAAAEQPLSVSIGVGLVLPTMGRSPQGAIQLADQALYEAKHAGRNRVVVKDVEDYGALDTGVFKVTLKHQ